MMRAAVLYASMTLLVLGCRLSDDEFDRLFRWMNCEECLAGERAAAASVGPKAVPTLARWLRDGPPADRQRIMRRKFQSAFRVSGGVLATAAETAYVSRLLDNYTDRYRQRSALSLSDIGTDDAKEALDDAIANAASRGYRPHVLATIRFARDRIGVAPFGGVLSPRIASFGDSVHVSLTPAAALTPAALASLAGQPFSAADLVLARAPTRLSFAAVAEPGRRWVRLEGFPGSPGARSADMMISTRADVSDRATRQCVDINYACLVLWAPPIGTPTPAPGPIAAASFPHTVFVSLSRSSPPIDTLDYFKIHLSSSKVVTAQLEWHDAANLDLEWRGCLPPLARLLPEDGVTPTNRPERTSTTVPGGECRLLVVKMASGAGASPTFARLTVTSP